ncbi:MAG TPA: tetratricopeptide repeat protein [Vicinamibacteria bacterium]
MHEAQLLFSVVWLLAASLQVRSSEEDLRAKAARGKELMAAGRYGEAAPVYRELVQAAPGNPGLLLNLGMALHLAGQDQEAVPQLEVALRLQPESLPAALFLGLANHRLGRTAEAVTSLRKAVQLQPDHVDARTALAEALLGLGRYVEAEPHLHRLTRLLPQEPATWFNLGKTYEELAGQAIRDLQQADPESAFGFALVAEGRAKEGRQSDAFHLYRQALDRAPSLRGMHAAIAEIYRGTGHPDWAAVEEERERALPRMSCPRDALECSFTAGKHRDVIVEAAPLKAPEAYYWLARAADQLAAQALERLTALPPSPQSHEWAAQIQANAGRFAESAEEWRKAIALLPRDPRLKLELAITLRQGRDFTAAQPVLEELVRTEPDSPEASYLLGDVLLARQQPERAVPVLEKAVRLEPKQAEAHGALGRAYALVGRPAEAIPHLTQALTTDTDGSVLYQLARSYQLTGQSEEAQAALRRYEQLRKAAPAESEGSNPGPPITPP